MKACSVSIYLAFAGFLNFYGAAAIRVMVLLLHDHRVVKATSQLTRVQHRPSWIANSRQEIFQEFEVFIDLRANCLYEGSLERLFDPRSHAEDVPVTVRFKLGVEHHAGPMHFKIYNHGITFEPLAKGYVFVAIPGTKRVYYAKLQTEVVS
ncbi:uncharacterized protein LOC117168192 [Belonocnema kinseyi]|uniref:uncharacterized protein LOC117168192 n=1 Tax=Belonocnema kinseyi TaxID=2817044 RepID=UPI00143DE9CB|nr:uncharacterized protein LOC117168192 [Belonocnema kinseyi]